MVLDVKRSAHLFLIFFDGAHPAPIKPFAVHEHTAIVANRESGRSGRAFAHSKSIGTAGSEKHRGDVQVRSCSTISPENIACKQVLHAERIQQASGASQSNRLMELQNC